MFGHRFESGRLHFFLELQVRTPLLRLKGLRIFASHAYIPKGAQIPMSITGFMNLCARRGSENFMAIC